MTPQVVIRFLALLTLFSNILLMALAILFALRNLKILSGYWDKIEKLLNKLALKLAFLVSLAATSGSLFLSEIAHFEPCKFCWFQRIFMYPLVFILGVAIYKKLKDAWLYVLPLSIIGGFIAIYHYFLQVNPEALAPCSATGFSVSCSERFFTYFGYITIPWMAFSAFILISLFMLLERSKSNSKSKS